MTLPKPQITRQVVSVLYCRKRKQGTNQIDEGNSEPNSRQLKRQAFDSGVSASPGGSKDNPVCLSEESEEESGQINDILRVASPSLSQRTVADSGDELQPLVSEAIASYKAQCRKSPVTDRDANTTDDAMGSTPSRGRCQSPLSTKTSNVIDDTLAGTPDADQLGSNASPVSSISRGLSQSAAPTS